MVTRVAIQCQDRLLRNALACRLSREEYLEVVGDVATGPDLLRLCELRGADMVLLEAESDAWNVLELVYLLRRRPGTRVVALHRWLPPEAADHLLRAGVTRLAARSGGLRALLRIVEEQSTVVARGNGHLAPPRAVLTDRELAVLRLIGQGQGLRDIARDLGISEHTVENHKRRIFAKLGTHSQTQAVADATRFGMFDSPTGHRLGAASPVAIDRTERRVLAVITGPAGETLRQATAILLANGVPLVVDHSAEASLARHPGFHATGTIVAVLIEPTPGDWEVAAALRARVIAVLDIAYDPAAAVTATLNGAHAVLAEADVADRLMAVFALVRDGYQVLDVRQGRLFVSAARSWASAGHPLTSLQLTPRERDILQHMQEGDSVKQTARALGVAVKTVESIQRHLFSKLGTRNRAAALAIAYELGLLGERSQLPTGAY
jgi:DNA-binding NarL/FixJ family response regulator